MTLRQLIQYQDQLFEMINYTQDKKLRKHYQHEHKRVSEMVNMALDSRMDEFIKKILEKRNGY